MNLEYIDYRGWRIHLQRSSGGWAAVIYRPGSRMAESLYPRSTDPAGRDTVLDQAKAYIEANG